MVQDNSEVKLGLNWTLIMDGDDEVEFVVHKFMTLTTEMSDWLAQSLEIFRNLGKSLHDFFLTAANVDCTPLHTPHNNRKRTAP
jgi:hypothetical protein